MKWICLHDYSKWSEAFSQNVASETSKKMQAKVCTKCGSIKLRYIISSTYVLAVTINQALREGR